jgi:hypothetical protein
MEEILFYLISYGIYILLSLVIIKLLFGSAIKFYHSYWNTLINSFEYSTEAFYKKFKKELLSHGVSGITTSDISIREGNIFSSRRRYIRVTWKNFQYDICAAPFGDGFFISWWLLDKLSWVQIIISLIPWLGPWLIRKLFTVTYYKIDTATMLMRFCHQSVLRVIDDITNDKGICSMSENERKPILNDIFKR